MKRLTRTLITDIGITLLPRALDIVVNLKKQQNDRNRKDQSPSRSRIGSDN